MPYRVHAFDPFGIDVAVQDDPLMFVRGVVGHVAKSDGYETLFPFACGGMQIAIEFVSRHGLRIDRLDDRFFAVIVLRAIQCSPDRRFSATGGAEQENGPTHFEDLSQLRRHTRVIQKSIGQVIPERS